MAKEIKAVVKLQLEAGKANPAPPVGTSLGPHGINLMQFCQQFNEATKDMAGNIVPAVITIFEDRTFEFVLKTPPAAELLKKAAGIERGSAMPHKDKVGKVTRKQIREIAEKKMADINAISLESAMKIVEGSAKSLGLEIID